MGIFRTCRRIDSPRLMSDFFTRTADPCVILRFHSAVLYHRRALICPPPPTMTSTSVFCMQQFFEYFAVIAFVAVYFLTRDVFLATGVLLVAITAQVAFYKLTNRPLSNELKVTFWVSLVLGGMTLVLRDETFIQWKPSIVSWAIALGLIGAQLFAKISLLKKMMGAAMTLEDSVWSKLTYGWAAGFALSGVINLWVVNNFSMDAWVTFKLFGLLGLNLLYVVIMVVYLVSIGALKDDGDAGQAKAVSGTSSGTSANSDSPS
jgi:intracellular septation protein